MLQIYILLFLWYPVDVDVARYLGISGQNDTSYV